MIDRSCVHLNGVYLCCFREARNHISERRVESMFSGIYFLATLVVIEAFIPHPSIRLGGQAGDSKFNFQEQHYRRLFSPGITHSEITQIAFVRSLARYLLETKAIDKYEIKNKEYTIDQLYRMTYPTWSAEKLHIHSYPLKSIVDTILVENAMVDMDRYTKKLPAAHFDSEAFRNASRRMIKIRTTSKSSFIVDPPW